MAFNESQLESYWKFMARIESLNKFSVIKKPSGIKMCNHWRMEEKTCLNLIKNLKKNNFNKFQRWEAILLILNMVKIVQHFQFFILYE